MIDMETDSDSIRGSLYIDAPPVTVFRALTDPKQLAQWWGSETTYRCTDWSLDLRPGGAWRSAGKNASGRPFCVEGEYVEIVPSRRLSYTWKPSWVDVPPTLVRWELAPEGARHARRDGPFGLRGSPKRARGPSGRLAECDRLARRLVRGT
jgi:uncharacterized protein YndB with AHSA1/START domain